LKFAGDSPNISFPWVNQKNALSMRPDGSKGIELQTPGVVYAGIELAAWVVAA